MNKTTDFLQSNRALSNVIQKVFDESTAENYNDNLRVALQPFGEDIVTALGGLQFA